MPDYKELASLTSRFPELLMIRRFDRLSAYVILALQADLLHLENQLNQYIELDRGNASLQNFLGSWGDMHEGMEEGHPILQVKKVQQIEEKLKTYRKLCKRSLFHSILKI